MKLQLNELLLQFGDLLLLTLVLQYLHQYQVQFQKEILLLHQDEKRFQLMKQK
jgi:hypothetical protein